MDALKILEKKLEVSPHRMGILRAEDDPERSRHVTAHFSFPPCHSHLWAEFHQAHQFHQIHPFLFFPRKATVLKIGKSPTHTQKRSGKAHRRESKWAACRRLYPAFFPWGGAGWRRKEGGIHLMEVVFFFFNGRGKGEVRPGLSWISWLSWCFKRLSSCCSLMES